MTFGSDDVGCNPEALLTLPNRGRSRFGCWRLRRLLETGLEIMKEYQSELEFYIENEPGKQSYLIQITRNYPEDTENPPAGKPGNEDGGGIIIT